MRTIYLSEWIDWNSMAYSKLPPSKLAREYNITQKVTIPKSEYERLLTVDMEEVQESINQIIYQSVTNYQFLSWKDYAKIVKGCLEGVHNWILPLDYDGNEEKDSL